MNNFEPKQGEMILVLPDGGGLWVKREFIAMHLRRWICVDGNSAAQVCLWANAKPLPAKPEPICLTHETWPKQIAHIKRGSWEPNVFDLVTGRYSKGVTHDGGRTTFDELLHDYQISLDFCQTWQPCHYVPTKE